MKKIPIISLWIMSLLLVGSLFLSSCDKDNSDPKTTAIPLIASDKMYDKKGMLVKSVSYQYDNQGRLIKKVESDDFYSTMEYFGSTVILKYYEVGELKVTSIAKLNEIGLCTTVSYDKNNQHAAYEYDSEGYHTSYTNETNIRLATTTYTVLEGNYVTTITEDSSKTENSAILKEVEFFQSSFISSNMENRITPYSKLKSSALVNDIKIECQYYNDKINTIGYENMGTPYFGKQNKNPVKTATYSFPINGDNTTYFTFTYTYEYDNLGRISKQISDNGDYWVFTYVD